MKWRPMSRRDEDLERELQSDLELEEEEQRERGVATDEARYAALRAFGNPTLIREQTHAEWSWNWLETLARDLRYGLRTLGRTPGFTMISIVVMALGIGANIALFTVVRSVLLKPLPYRDPSRLVMMYEFEKGKPGHTPWLPVDAGSFWEWQRAAQPMAQLAMVSPFQGYNVSAESGQLPENVDAAWCTSNFFSLLGVRLVLGRDFTADDDRPGAPAVAIISAEFWRRRYAADPAVVGRSIWLDAKPYTVIGVLPSTFVYSGAFGGNHDHIWTPVSHEAPPALLRMYSDHEFQVVARLAEGVSLVQLQSRLDALQKQIKAAHADGAVHPGVIGRSMLDDVVEIYKTPLYALLAAAGCVLLIACMNVAGLLVARAASRQKEFAIRTALGGGWLRLIRERLIESLLLTAAGGALGLLLAWGALAWLIHARPDMHRIEAIRMDGAVAGFMVAIVALCAVFSGLVSALSIRGKNVLAGLQENSRAQAGSRSRAVLRRALLTMQVGLTVILLVGAGLLIKSFAKLRSTDIGVPVDNMLTLQFDLPAARYHDPGKDVAFFEKLIAGVRALPGVSAAGLASTAPGEGWGGDRLMTIGEHPAPAPGQGVDFMIRGADPGYFQAIGLPLLEGRVFRSDERLERANVVLISRGAAQQYFPGEDPIGKHLKAIGGNGVWEVIGVVGDARWSIAQPAQPTLYWPIFGNGYTGGTIVVRAQHDVEAQAIPVQKVVSSLDQDLPVSNVMTLREGVDRRTIDSAFDSVLVMAFATIALVLAAAGLYGVLAYLVTQRTAEFGIRIALGARRNDVLRKVLLDGIRPAVVGLVIGLAASAAAVRLIQSLLYQTKALDPAVFVAVAGILLLVALAACSAPAWRAARMDPMQALRTE